MLHKTTSYVVSTPSHGAGPSLQFGPEGWKGSMVILIPGATPQVIAQARIDFMGYSTIRVSGTLRYISRELPYSLPFYEITDGPNNGQDGMWCSSFAVNEGYTLTGNEWEMVGKGLPKFGWAKCTLGFSSTRFGVRADNDAAVVGQSGALLGKPDESRLNRYTVVSYKPSVRTITCPQGLLYAVPASTGGEGAPAALAFGLPLNEGMVSLQVRHVDVPEINLQAIRRQLGTINTTAFAGFTAGTLMFTSCELNPSTQSTGRDAYSIDFMLTHRAAIAKTSTDGATAGVTERSWSYFLKLCKNSLGIPSSRYLDYRALSADGTLAGTPPFRSTEFRDLLRASQTPP